MLRRGSRVRLPARLSTPDAGARCARARARAGGPSGDHDPHPRALLTSAACSCSPRSPSRSPAGAFRSTPSTSPTCSRPRTRPTACWPEYEAAHELPEIARRRRRSAAARCSATASPPDYVAIMGYVQPSAGVRRGRRRAARGDPRRPTKATTTFGYGPRFLHSTGQFHKGGPKTGRFLQLLHDGPAGRRDPGQAIHVHHAQERPGDRRPGDAARARPARRARAPAGR